jgi:molybdopterin synthase sulfur carrier subunit
MNITVKVFATLRDFMPGVQDIDVAGGTDLAMLLERLCGQYPGLREEIFDAGGSLKPYVNVLKNGRNVFFINNLATRLEEGDTLAIFPPVAGG